MGWVLGLDVSLSRITTEWWDGVQWGIWGRPQVLVQNLWPGGWASHKEFQAVAGPNLRDARAAGITTAGYLVASPWYDAYLALDEARRRAGDEWPHLVALFVDVETIEWRGNTYWPSPVDTWSLLEACASTGKRVGIYTASWFWQSYYRGDTDARWRRWPLWNAVYSESPIVDPPGYGPWKKEDVVGIQFRGSIQVAGAWVDVNIFREEFFQEVKRMKVPWLRDDWTLEEKELPLEEALQGIVSGRVPVPVNWNQQVPLWLEGTPWVGGERVPPHQRPTLQHLAEALFWFLRQERHRILERLSRLEEILGEGRENGEGTKARP